MSLSIQTESNNDHQLNITCCELHHSTCHVRYGK
eukprot:07122.XXX_103021_103122_1 [CDS] Oithona nana genome sequencing.